MLSAPDWVWMSVMQVLISTRPIASGALAGNAWLLPTVSAGPFLTPSCHLLIYLTLSRKLPVNPHGSPSRWLING